MRHLIALAVLLLAVPGLADDAPAAKPSGTDAHGQTSDTNAPEDPAHEKGYGYGTPSGVESNASADQAAAKKNGTKKKAPQQEADHDSAQPNPKAAEQGQNAGPMDQKNVHSKKRAHKTAKPATKPAAPPAGEPTR